MPTLTVARTPTCAVLAAVLAAMRPKVILLTPRELSSFASLYEKSPAKLAANVATVPVMERADAEKKRVRRRPMALTMMPLSGGTRSGADVYRGKPLGGSAAKEAGGCCCATGGGCVFSSGNERTVRSAGRTRPVRAWERRGGMNTAWIVRGRSSSLRTVGGRCREENQRGGKSPRSHCDLPPRAGGATHFCGMKLWLRAFSWKAFRPATPTPRGRLTSVTRLVATEKNGGGFFLLQA